MSKYPSYSLDEIDKTIELMEKRALGSISECPLELSMCRLSLPMTFQLRAMLEVFQLEAAKQTEKNGQLCIEITTLQDKRKDEKRTYKKSLADAMSHRKDSERRLLEKIRKLELQNTKLQQENSFVRHRSCGQKATYNAKIAQLWAVKNNQRAYKCKFCNGWHLASKKTDITEAGKCE